METSTPTSSSPATPVSTESKAQEQARLRRERRNAKIQAGGSERLNKINAISGRPQAAAAELEKSPAQSTRSLSATATQDIPDPDEIDITGMIQPQRPDITRTKSQQETLKAMFRDLDDGANSNTGGARPVDSSDDPMLQMMRQMQSMLGGAGSTEGGAQDLPSGLEEFFRGGGPAAQTQQEPQTSANYIWRIVHALSSILLGIYAVISFTFAGSELERMEHQDKSTGPRLFWMFTTSELLLQSGRYFIDGGRLPGTGILTTIGRFLPDPWGNYVRVINRYSIIYTTLLADAMVLVFVLGISAWWKGLAAS